MLQIVHLHNLIIWQELIIREFWAPLSCNILKYIQTHGNFFDYPFVVINIFHVANVCIFIIVTHSRHITTKAHTRAWLMCHVHRTLCIHYFWWKLNFVSVSPTLSLILSACLVGMVFFSYKPENKTSPFQFIRSSRILYRYHNLIVEHCMYAPP